jgi:hypothetical protein
LFRSALELALSALRSWATAATGAFAGGADVRVTSAGYLRSSDQRRKDAAERAARFGLGALK